MKKLLLLFLLNTAILIQLNAQDYFKEFGKISPDQLVMKSCSFDPTADAVVLFDVGKSGFVRVDNGFDVLFQHITRIKILHEAGKQYAEVSIPFYQEGSIYEQVEIVKACTYTIINGRISKISQLDPKSCYEEKISENWKTMKFAMPDVQPGSIIEYTYNIRSQYHFNLRDWEFQWDIPVLYSAYEVRMIPFYEYAWAIQGRKSIDDYKAYEDSDAFEQVFYNTKYREMVYFFGLKNVPAFKDEEFSPSREDDIIKIDFQLSAFYHLNGVKINIMTTWPELVNDYQKNTNFGKYVRKSEKSASNVLDPDSLDGKTQLQQLNYIVDYAKNNFKWNHENSQFSNKSPSELQKDKIGNSADINLWLVGAFKSAGIEAYPVVISTRRHGKIHTDYPFSSAFNSIIAYALADGIPILADATDPFCPNNRISIQYMNDKGLLVNNDNIKWLSLQSPVISGLSTSIKIDSIGEEQKANIIITATDYEALSYRNKYAGNHDILLTDLSKKDYQVDDSSLKFRYELDRTRPYSFMYNLTYKSEIINEKIYLQPFLNEVFSDNPLKQKTRTYPVDMTYPVKRTYLAEIKIPDGYQVQFLPVKSSLNDDLFELDYVASQNEETINVSFTYAFKHPVYTPEEYSRVKAMFDRIVKKSTEKIVLVQR
ncbi:MAG: DUF3857 domain-containing protein [Lentimicrobiaceae bacterium]|jgi:hypothetical protein